MSLLAGSRIVNDEIVEPIGAGGMGEVYRACDTKLGRDVASRSCPMSSPSGHVCPPRPETVRGALTSALATENESGAVLCHVSHPYRDGASLYFTFFERCPADPQEAVARWAELERAATSAIVAGGGTLTRPHGIESWHSRGSKKKSAHKGYEL